MSPAFDLWAYLRVFLREQMGLAYVSYKSKSAAAQVYKALTVFKVEWKLMVQIPMVNVPEDTPLKQTDRAQCIFHDRFVWWNRK
jgi:hypothetical protein